GNDPGMVADIAMMISTYVSTDSILVVSPRRMIRSDGHQVYRSGRPGGGGVTWSERTTTADYIQDNARSPYDSSPEVIIMLICCKACPPKLH
ncbi:hypothetical protein COCVIDRAFT_116032, partial [Bipolaris victoriae FI3]